MYATSFVPFNSFKRSDAVHTVAICVTRCCDVSTRHSINIAVSDDDNYDENYDDDDCYNDNYDDDDYVTSL